MLLPDSLCWSNAWETQGGGGRYPCGQNCWSHPPGGWVLEWGFCSSSPHSKLRLVVWCLLLSCHFPAALPPCLLQLERFPSFCICHSLYLVIWGLFIHCVRQYQLLIHFPWVATIVLLQQSLPSLPVSYQCWKWQPLNDLSRMCLMIPLACSKHCNGYGLTEMNCFLWPSSPTMYSFISFSTPWSLCCGYWLPCYSWHESTKGTMRWKEQT